MVEQVSVFCEFYPAYRLEHIRKIKARLFFRFLNEGYRRYAQRMLDLAIVSRIPHMEKKDAQAAVDVWLRAVDNPLDKFAPNNDYSAIDKLEKAL